MTHTKKEQLTETAQNFFHLLQQFAKIEKTNDLRILIFEQPVQDLTLCTFIKNFLIQKKKVK